METIAITLLFMRSSPSSILRVIYKIILEMHYCNFDFGFTSMFFVVFFFDDVVAVLSSYHVLTTNSISLRYCSVLNNL